jgi:hypothetical protein
MEPGERKEILEMSGLCLFCLKHAAELECYGRGGLSKPRCTQAGCDGEHTPGVYKLMTGESAGVNLIAEDEGESEEDEDEEWWVGTIGVTEVRGGGEETLGEEGNHELEDGPELHSDTRFPERPERDGWCSPEFLVSSSEEDEEEAQRPSYAPDPRPPRTGSADRSAGDDSRGLAIAPDGPRKEEPPCPLGAKRRRPRRKAERTMDREWEQARRDTWLRGMLSDTSSGEVEDGCERFTESRRWNSELCEAPRHPATTSGGECSG